MLVDLLANGASPAIACRQLGVSFFVYLNTWCREQSFRQHCEAIGAALSQNVAAALYRQAIEGSVSAQTFWLRNHPPPEWKDAMKNEGEQSENREPDGLDELSDEELRRLATALSISMEAEHRSRTADSRDSSADRGNSQAGAD